MPLHRIHTYQTVRVTYEIDAADPLAALAIVQDGGFTGEPVEVSLESAEWTRDFIVDPILPNGEVDYDNVLNINGEAEWPLGLLPE